ncbi:MAG: HNH endonuclease [Flavobacteriales bacterium]|jgi:hypothetical protein|nr:HNH endonuclease [Flavobacteriales bacterium]
MIINLRNEVWKEFSRAFWHPFETLKVSNYGRVIRYKYNPEGELLKPYKLGGYEVFSIGIKNGKTGVKKGKTDLIYIHRAVAELFLETEEKPFVIHKDYNKTNNHVDNLEYVDRKGLSAHTKKNPAVIQAKKDRIGNYKYGKLTEGKVKIIKRKIFDPNRKTRMRIIAKQFGISEMQLYRIKNGENWGHVDY